MLTTVFLTILVQNVHVLFQISQTPNDLAAIALFYFFVGSFSIDSVIRRQEFVWWCVLFIWESWCHMMLWMRLNGIFLPCWGNTDCSVILWEKKRCQTWKSHCDWLTEKLLVCEISFQHWNVLVLKSLCKFFHDALQIIVYFKVIHNYIKLVLTVLESGWLL